MSSEFSILISSLPIFPNNKSYTTVFPIKQEKFSTQEDYTQIDQIGIYHSSTHQTLLYFHHSHLLMELIKQE